MGAEGFDKTPVLHVTCNEKHYHVEKSISGMSELYSRFAHLQEKHNEEMHQMIQKIFDKIDDINKQGLGIRIDSVEKELTDHKTGFGHWKPLAFLGGIITGTIGIVISLWEILYRK